MPSLTDERLRYYLDSNQVHREQMCRSILAVDKRFSEVRPRHPRGGPDGGRDIEAIFRSEQRALCAVGFINGANDSAEQKKRIRKKFRDDLTNALKVDEKLEVFVFMTNLGFSLGEKDQLVAAAKKAGIKYCEIIDRERLRIALDAPSGFFIRFQYLSIPLSEAEQASFLSQYGDEIQSIVATGFQRVDKMLNRILFLQEASDVLNSLIVHIELDRQYTAEEIAHFRAFCLVSLREIKHSIFQILFGSSDKSDRMRPPSEHTSTPELPGIEHGISSGQWEYHVDVESKQTHEGEKYEPVGYSSSVGATSARFITIRYAHDDTLIRFRPRLNLRDLDECMFMPILNESLAVKVKTFHVFANGYKLDEIGKAHFRVDVTDFEPGVPARFTAGERGGRHCLHSVSQSISGLSAGCVV